MVPAFSLSLDKLRDERRSPASSSVETDYTYISFRIVKELPMSKIQVLSNLDENIDEFVRLFWTDTFNGFFLDWMFGNAGYIEATAAKYICPEKYLR